MTSIEDSKKQAEMVNVSKQPWFNAAYKSALEFYEKDSQLDSKDRLELSRIYGSIGNAQLYGGWLGFSAVFLPPFFWQFYKTNSVKGVKVPRNFLLSLPMMVIGSYLASNYVYNKKMSDLDATGSFATGSAYANDNVQQPLKSNSQRQWEMMELLRNGGATKWAAYFYMTFQNPERRLPDPKVKLMEMLEGKTPKEHGILQNRDILGLYTGPEAEKRHREGIQRQQEEHHPPKSAWEAIREGNGIPEEGQKSSMAGGSGTAWDRIREKNSSHEKTQQQGSVKYSNDDSDPFALSEEPSQPEFDAMLERERRGNEN